MEKGILPIGYKRIIDLSIGNVKLSILGEIKDLTTKEDTSDGYEKYAKSSRVKIRYSNTVDMSDSDELILFENMHFINVNGKNIACPPLFCEYTEYTISAEIEGVSKDSQDVISIWHENQNIRNRMKYIFGKKSSVSGGFSFDGDIGYSDFVIRINGRDFVTLTLEAFPTKISYKGDYEAIRDDIVNEFYALIFDVLKKTYSGFQLSSERKPSRLEFYSIFRAVYKEYMNAIDYIIQKTHHQLKIEYNTTFIQKAKRIDSKSIVWLQKHPEHLHILENGEVLIDRVLSVKKYVSYDTKENRYAKQIIMKTLWRLRDFKRNYLLFTAKTDDEGMKRKEDEDFIKSLELQISGIEKKLKSSFFDGLECHNESIHMSLVFAMAPGYRELYRCHLKMEQSLKILDEVFNMSQKDIARLYEYWCFIKLNSIVSEKLNSSKTNVKRIGENELITKLQSSTSSCISYDIDEANKINLFYNLERSKLPTITQKPDNVLTIERSGTSKMQYIFDAKYKISANKKTGEVGPTEEDINTMHRYRDAIVSEDGGLYSRDMIGAYVLFPFEDIEGTYVKHPFYKSINEVNIGGLPFLPSQTECVETMIDKMIKDMDRDVSTTPEDKYEILMKYYKEMNAIKRPI